MKKFFLVILFLFLLGLAVLWQSIGSDIYALYKGTSTTTALADYKLQDDSKVTLPEPLPLVEQAYNPLKNVYWGDLHVHTTESFDAVLFGTTLDIADAYRFAAGESLQSAGGETMQLSRPMDFVAITDHAESFGTRTRCTESNLSWREKFHCSLMGTPNIVTFLAVQAIAGENSEKATSDEAPGVYQNQVRPRPSLRSWPICAGDEDDPDRCYRDSIRDWTRYKQLADKHYQPGILTTFAAYEYSPPLTDAGKHHRNVIFNGADLPEHAASYLDQGSAIDLWSALEESCTGQCDFLTIPHNMNKSWGLVYSPHTWDGKTYDEQAWRLRSRREPLAEIYQVKGSSECALGVGAADEECGFGQVLPPCEQGQVSGCAFTTSFARQGLKIGLQLQQELGFNPLAFGMIGATDTHNASPGDAEEWDFVGKVAAASSPAARRMKEWPDRRPFESMLQFHTSGGLAAVWAEENTRDSIFQALQRREVYATSGPRITLRFFAGWGFDSDIAAEPEAIALATAGGVPMGGVLETTGKPDSPMFFVWAGADLMSAPLQRLQMVKGWVASDGKTHEVVTDIACAGGLPVSPDTGRCANNDATVNTDDCSLLGENGSPQLATTWKDPDYQSAQSAFYYVRALQNPTCRWSTYDALRLGLEPPSHVPATIRERAWSSPIWLNPNN